MSKIGKKNILVPKDSSVKSENGITTITGPKGSKTLSINFSKKIWEWPIFSCKLSLIFFLHLETFLGLF